MVQNVSDQLAQASWFLQVEVISLAQASRLLARASGTLKFFKNDHFTLHFGMIFGSNIQPLEHKKLRMNLPYLNKNIYKYTIYKTTRN